MSNWTSKLIEANVKESDFLKDWIFTDRQNDCDYVLANLARFLSGQFLNDRGKKYFIATVTDIENVFGLPYTSSSSYAAVWNTNGEFFLNDTETFTLQGFALTSDYKIIALFSDIDDNEKFLEVPQS